MKSASKGLSVWSKALGTEGETRIVLVLDGGVIPSISRTRTILTKPIF